MQPQDSEQRLLAVDALLAADFSQDQLLEAFALAVDAATESGDEALMTNAIEQADQLALPLALAVAGAGRPAAYTCTELTEHSRTNFGVIERFLDVRFDTRLEVSRAGKQWRVDVLPGAA
jgi:RNA 3'-terminal phosphate cyclase (ATP)